MLWCIISTVFFILIAWIFTSGCPCGAGKVALKESVFKPFKLIEKIAVSHDTHIFRFALDKPTQTLGLPIGKHIYIRAQYINAEGKQEVVQHPYTPISSDDEKGYVDFLIKVYFKNTHPKFPSGGRLSQHLYNMAIGSTVDMRGPVGKFEYKGNGNYTIEKIKDQFTRGHADAFAMIAGGTGITPIMQLIRSILKSPEDRTNVFLVYANQTPNDILLREELDKSAEDPRIHVWYTVDRDVPSDWKYSVGHVNEEMFRDNLPNLQPKNDKFEKVFAIMCGPPLMLERAVRPNLEKIGYANENMFAF